MGSSRRYDSYNDDFYHSHEWKEVRRQALDRDNHLCQICLSHNKYTFANTVHHIKPIRANKAESLRLDNLMTVCASCHNKLHQEKAKNRRQKNRYLKSYTKGIKKIRPNREIW